MKFLTLNNKEINVEVNAALFRPKNQEDCKSFGQYNLGRRIIDIFGESCVLLEEFPIPGERLFLDFLLLHYRIAFEFHGSQHSTFNKFFHSTKQDFVSSIKRDTRKAEWCQKNKIRLICIDDPNISKQALEHIIQNE